MKRFRLPLNLKYLLFIFLLISLQSCGYNLRESPSFLFNKNIAVISDSNSLNRLFIEELRKANNNVLIYKKEEPVKLSPKENQLLRLLALHINDLMPREKALNKIWRDDNYFTSRSMDVYIAKLRKYLKQDSKVEILNIHGEGFRLVVSA